MQVLVIQQHLRTLAQQLVTNGKFHKKVSNHISRQVPEFVLSEHPQFVDFLKQYFIFMNLL